MPLKMMGGRFKPVAFGSGIWIMFFALGLTLQLFVEPLYTNYGTRVWIIMAAWFCYSSASVAPD